jgi:hypothetical protein
MVNRCQPGLGRWVSLATIGAFMLSAPMITGCSTPPMTAQHTVDPLLGNSTPPGTPILPASAPKATNTPITPPPTSSSSNGNGIPPIPTNNSATNPATLASYSGFQVSLAKPLAIDDEGRPQTPGQLTARTQPPGYVPPNAAPKFEPVPDANASAPSITPTGSWQLPATSVPPALPPVQSAIADPAEALRQQLQARGVVNQKVDSVANGVHLTCFVPRTDSQGLRVLEVTAADYPTAAQAILRQLEPGPK